MSKFTMTRLSVAAGIGLLGASSAFAAPTCPETLDVQADYKCVFIDTGVNKYAAGTKTGSFYELGITGTLATSIYGLNGSGIIGAGSSIIDTNRTSVINTAGFVGNSNYNSLSGGVGTVGINDTASISRKNVDSLNSLDAFDNTQTQGLNSAGGYLLTYDYQFNGVLGALGPSFNSGDLAVYYTDLATNVVSQVLRVNITGSTLNLANLDLVGTVSFDFDNNGSNDCTTAFCQNFWNFQTGPQNWFALVDGSGVSITFALDTNVNPPIPTADQLGIGTVPGLFARQTTLDSSVRFNVPEPGTLALAGLMLVGMAARSVRRNRKL